MRAFHRRVLLESLLSIWRVDINHAFRMCEDWQGEVGASEVSNVSWDRVEDTWPG